MKRFFDLTFRPFFVLTGIGTAAAFIYAFWPEWALPQIAKIAHREEYTNLVRYFGIMVGLMGGHVGALGVDAVPPREIPVKAASKGNR